MAVAAAALSALCAGLLAPAQPAVAATFVPIDGAGSTWAYPAIHSWISGASQAGVIVNYTASGSTSGRAFFKNGTSDWAQGVMLFPTVVPAGPGLGSTPAVLASAPAGLGNGFGTTTLGANLELLIPALQAAGDYTSGLSITAVSTNP